MDDVDEAEPLPVFAGQDIFGVFAQPSQRKPRQFHPFAADDNAYFYGLRWNHWGREKARARGKAAANTCDPFCAAGTFVRSRGARATLFRLREGRCDGEPAMFYTRALLRWPKRLRIPEGVYKLNARCID